MTTKMKTSYRVKHQPAQTVYTIQCHDIITLTMPYGYPPGRPGFEHAERRDELECWQLWCHERGGGVGERRWVVSEHATKEEARAALLEARRTKEATRRHRAITMTFFPNQFAKQMKVETLTLQDLADRRLDHGT